MWPKPCSFIRAIDLLRCSLTFTGHRPTGNHHDVVLDLGLGHLQRALGLAQSQQVGTRRYSSDEILARLRGVALDFPCVHCLLNQGSSFAGLEHGGEVGFEIGKVGVDFGLGFQIATGCQFGRANGLSGFGRLCDRI